MKTYPDDYNAYHYSRSKEPRFTVRIDFASDLTDPVYVLSHADSATPVGATIISSRIESGSVVSQELKEISSFGSISIVCVDNASALTNTLRAKLQSGKGVRLKRVRIYQGFKGLDWEFYQTKATQIIGELSYKDGAYTIKCNDIQRLAKDTKLFVPNKTTLKTAITATENKLYVYNSTFNLVAHGTSYSDAPSRKVFYVKLEDEIIRCSSVGNDGGGAFLNVDYINSSNTGRGALNTKAVAHAVNASDTPERRPAVTEYIYIEMPAVKMIYAILLGVLYGQVGETFPWSINADTEYIKNADFTTALISDLWTTTDDTKGVVARFEGLTAYNGKEFIERELLPLIGCFMPVYADGSIGLKRRSAILENAAYVQIIDNSNVIDHGSLTYDCANVANKFRVNWNWSTLQEKYTRTTTLLYPDSIQKHGETEFRDINLRGLYGGRHTETTVSTIIDLSADRAVYPQWRIDVELLPRMDVLENGDVISLQLSTLRDFAGTGATINRSFEVVSTAVDLISGKVTAKLQGASERVPPYSTLSQNVVLPDAWYTSQGGTSVATALGAAYSLGHVVSNATLTGAATLTGGVYYHTGDLTIDAGVTLTVTQNVFLLVRGILTINGTINGNGQGIAGITGGYGQQSPVAQYSTNLGGTLSGGGWSDFVSKSGPAGVFTWAKPYSGGVTGTSGNFNNVVVDYNGSALTGLPSDLRGAPGAAGSGIRDGGVSNLALGGSGGASGAGLCIIARGTAFGVSGKITLNGAAGGNGVRYTYDDGPFHIDAVSGAGAGGSPGSLLILLDGAAAVVPDENFDLYPGAPGSDLGANDVIKYAVSYLSDGYELNKVPKPWKWGRTFDTSATNNKGWHSRVLFIKSPQTVQGDSNETSPAPVTNLTVQSGTSYLLTMKDGSVWTRAYLAWTPSVDKYVDHYAIYYKKTTDSQYTKWQDEPTRSESNTYVHGLIDGVAYDFAVEAVNVWGYTSARIAASHNVVGKLENPAPPTSLTATAGIAKVSLSIAAANMPTDADIIGVEYWWSTTNDRATVTTTNKVTSGAVPGQKWAAEFTAAVGTTVYVWCRSVDSSRLPSAWYPSSATAGVAVTPQMQLRDNNGNLIVSETGGGYINQLENGFRETWESGSVENWEVYTGQGQFGIASVSDSMYGGKILVCGNNSGNNQVWLVHKKNIPFNPSKLYKLLLRVRRTAGVGVVYAGWTGVAADGVTFVATDGANTYGNQHYHCAYGYAPGSAWVEYVGYTKGHGATVGDLPVGSVQSPSKMHPNVRYVRPMLLVNYNNGQGVTDIDGFVVETAGDMTQNALDNGILTTGYLAVKNATFGQAGAQMRYNATNDVGEIYAGDGQDEYVKIAHDGVRYRLDIGPKTTLSGASHYAEDEVIYLDRYFNDVSLYDGVISNGGVISINHSYGTGKSVAYVYSSAANNSFARLRENIGAGLSGSFYGKGAQRRSIKTRIAISGNMANKRALFYTGGGAGTPATYTRAGIYIDSNMGMYGFITTGGQGISFSVSLGITASYDTFYKLEIVSTASSTYFYVDGVNLGTLGAVNWTTTSGRSDIAWNYEITDITGVNASFAYFYFYHLKYLYERL